MLLAGIRVPTERRRGQFVTAGALASTPVVHALPLHSSKPHLTRYPPQLQTYDAQVVEVTRSGKLAWEMTVKGKICDNKGGCDRSDNGWDIYSAERFYTSPLVWNFTCSLRQGGKKLEASFATVNTFRQNSVTAGSWSLANRKSGDELAGGTFGWHTHWYY